MSPEPALCSILYGFLHLNTFHFKIKRQKYRNTSRQKDKKTKKRERQKDKKATRKLHYEPGTCTVFASVWLPSPYYTSFQDKKDKKTKYRKTKYRKTKIQKDRKKKDITETPVCRQNLVHLLN